jgi:hypothetical protein
MTIQSEESGVPHSEDVELWTASRVISMHYSEGRCKQCPPDSSGAKCPLLLWADTRLRMWEESNRRRYPDQAPGWQAIPKDRHPYPTAR